MAIRAIVGVQTWQLEFTMTVPRPFRSACFQPGGSQWTIDCAELTIEPKLILPSRDARKSLGVQTQLYARLIWAFGFIRRDLRMTYDEWLRLTDAERDEIHFHQWDLYHRDGIVIAFTAATRLAIHSPFKVYDIRVGTFHGPEYTLEPCVSQDDYPSCPPMLAQRFEGFRVIWLPIGLFCHSLTENGTFDGTWVEDCAEPDSEFTITRPCFKTLIVPHLLAHVGSVE